MPARSIEAVRIVFDENLIGLAKGLMPLRSDATVFGHPLIESIIPTGTLDVDWITEVGQRGWVLVTNDRRLRTRPDEAAAAVAHKLKVVHLHGSAGTAKAWGQAERVFQRWAAIEQQINTAPVGPWWLSIESTRHRLLNFQPGFPQR